jgi:hypothetical protein
LETCTHDGFEEFDNEWEAVASTPSENFITLSFNEVFNRASSWELPEAYVCIVRCQDPSTKKIEERCFKSTKRAESYIGKQETIGYEVTSFTNDRLYFSPGFAAVGLEPDNG